MLSVVSDELTPNGEAQVISAKDYYPFGMSMPGRTTEGGIYRYGFNGKETDQETGIQDYGMRWYLPNICRFPSVDPITKDYPELTPYQFASNRPMDGIDLDGLEYISTNHPAFTNSAGGGVCNQENAERLRTRFETSYRKIMIGGLQYYDVGKHLYFNFINYNFSDKPTALSYKATHATQAGAYLIDNYLPQLPRRPQGVGTPPTFDHPELSFDAYNQYINCGGMCFAITMGRMNHAYKSTYNISPLILCDDGGCLDFKISGGIDRAINTGYGVGGALAHRGAATLFNTEEFWSGKAESGAAIQWWWGNEQQVTTSLNSGKQVNGHSMIFSSYIYDNNGNITGFIDNRI